MSLLYQKNVFRNEDYMCKSKYLFFDLKIYTDLTVVREHIL